MSSDTEANESEHEGGEATPEDESTTGEAWVGSDATFHTYSEGGFEHNSEIAIAIAVDDRDQFNTRYRSIIETKAGEYNSPLKRPVLKSHEVREMASEWEYDDVITNVVEDLLDIDNILNIHVTVTNITNQMVTAYEQGRGPPEQISRDRLHGELRNYYHLIAIWDYLDEYRDAPWGTDNVLLDDFEGKDNNPWRRTGKISDSLHVIPQGDVTYPLLSLADLTMDYVKEKTEEWTASAIRDTLISATPDDTAYVNTKGFHTPEDVSDLVPIARRNINRSRHYPHPIVFIDRGGIDRDELTNYELYHTIAEYVYEESGCMKYFSETEDGNIVEPEDYIVCLDESDTHKYKKFERYNNSDEIVLTPSDAFDEFD